MVDGKPADYGPIIKANQARSTAYEVFDVSPLALEVTEWPGDRVNKRFGQWYNDWIYLDAVGRTWPLN